MHSLLSHGLFKDSSRLCVRGNTKLSLALTTTTLDRFFASSASTPSKDPPPPDTSLRHRGIALHQDSIGQYILPGNVVSKKTLAGKHVWQPVSLEYGHFWMLRELRQTNDKPVLTTKDGLIPESDAKLFPILDGLECLDKEKPNIDIPMHWLRRNRTGDPAAQCTVVGMAFRDYGYAQLQDDWWPAVQEKVKSSRSAVQERVELVRLALNEGYWQRYLLKGLVTASMRRNTTDPVERAATWIHFATDLASFRDPLRVHNVLPAYVYVLDGVGRVRWVACGPAADGDLDSLWNAVQEILRPTLQNQQQQKQQQQQKLRRNVPKR